MLNSLRSDRRIPKPLAHPVLLGEPERAFKVNPNTKPTHIIYRHSGIPLAGIHSLLFLDTGLRRYDERFSLDVSTSTSAAIDQVLTVLPFVLSSTAGLERNSARTV